MIQSCRKIDVSYFICCKIYIFSNYACISNTKKNLCTKGIHNGALRAFYHKLYLLHVIYFLIVSDYQSQTIKFGQIVDQKFLKSRITIIIINYIRQCGWYGFGVNLKVLFGSFYLIIHYYVFYHFGLLRIKDMDVFFYCIICNFLYRMI